MAFENLKSEGIKYLLTKLKGIFLQIKDAVLSVNGNTPNEYGEITLSSVPYAQNLESESSQRKTGTFIQRMAGGDGSISDGNAWLMSVRGNNVHTGFVPESLELECSNEDLTVSIDRDTFVEAVSASGTITLTFTSSWSADPATYGVTVSGTPASGDTITIVYVKEVAGSIAVSMPMSFVATGWNLYDHANERAKVVKYSHGYKITGSYTTIKFSTTESGSQSAIEVTNGFFDVPSDGYVHVTGGNATNTAIFPVWTDWEDGYKGGFKEYTETVIDLSGLFGEGNLFPYGLMKAGSVVDELDVNLGQAISRVDRIANTEENMAAAAESGRPFEYDEDYIYIAKATPVTSNITIAGEYDAYDHGIEYFVCSTNVPIDAETLYGNNLKNKLERDVLTLSQQTLTAAQQAQVQENIGVPSKDALEAVSDLATGTASSLGVLSLYIKSIPVAPGIKLTIQSTQTVYWLAIAMSTTTTYRGMWLLCRQGSNGRTTATPVLDSSIVSITGSTDSSEFIVSKTGSSSAYICLISLYSSNNKLPDIVDTRLQ